MTTTIASKFGAAASLHLTRADRDPNEIHVQVDSASSSAMLNVTLSALLGAVRSELGVLIIDKADLPIVTDRGVHGNLFVADVPWAASLSVEALRQEAYDRLALAEYLEAHPPVDPEAVAALHAEIEVSAASGRLGIAEHLVRVGYRKVAEQ